MENNLTTINDQVTNFSTENHHSRKQKYSNGDSEDLNGREFLKKQIKLNEKNSLQIDNVEKIHLIADSYLSILNDLGEDSNREGLRKTPMRAAKAMAFFTKGYKDDLKEIVQDACFDEGSDGIVIVKDIEFFSLCEHHMVFFLLLMYSFTVLIMYHHTKSLRLQFFHILFIKVFNFKVPFFGKVKYILIFFTKKNIQRFLRSVSGTGTDRHQVKKDLFYVFYLIMLQNYSKIMLFIH